MLKRLWQVRKDIKQHKFLVTVFISGFTAFFYNQFKADDPNIVYQALMIFVFDMFVDNADRGQGKPNLFLKRKFDCFGPWTNFLVFKFDIYKEWWTVVGFGDLEL